ncbi:MAG: GDSL-type esterase/lipase family protein [Polyangiaceae bacterium]
MRFQTEFTFLALLLFACSGTDDVSRSAAGSGGANAAGGGSPSSEEGGGSTGIGGASSTNGVPTTGGSVAVGGATSIGGSVSNGGALNTVGSSNTGGVRTSGGASSTGGSVNNGGSVNKGGATNVGGSVTSGGSHSTGGSIGTGGGPGSGGFSAGGGPADVVAAGVRWVGRVDVSNASQPTFSYSETGFVASFTGTGFSVSLSDAGDAYYTAVIDGTTVRPMLHGGTGTVTVTAASGLSAGTHTIAFYRQTEGASAGITTFKGITVTGGSLGTPPKGPGRLIEVIGDSITCGYGDLCTSNKAGFRNSEESAHDSWGAVAARLVGADVSIVAKSGIGIFRDNGGSTANTMPNVYGRTHYSSANPAWGFTVKPQAVLINLGTNDFAKGDPGQANFEGAMLSFVKTVRTKYPDAYILLTIGSLGNGAAKYLQNVVTQSKDAKVSYFALQQQTSADAGCDYHPNVGRQLIMGQTAAAAIKAKLGW